MEDVVVFGKRVWFGFIVLALGVMVGAPFALWSILLISLRHSFAVEACKFTLAISGSVAGIGFLILAAVGQAKLTHLILGATLLISSVAIGIQLLETVR